MRFGQLLAAGFACLGLASCAGENWKWDWWNKESSQPKQKPVTRTTTPRPADETRTAKAPIPPAEAAPAPENKDAQDKELQEKVDRYVQAMTASSDGPRPGYNDFNAKIQRQQDPNRQSRVRRVAERDRDEEQPTAQPAADADRSKPVEPSVTAASPITERDALPAETISRPTGGDKENAPRTSQEPPRAAHAAPPTFNQDYPQTEPVRSAAEPTTPRTPERLPGSVIAGPPHGESGTTVDGAVKAEATKPSTEPKSEKPARPPVLEDVTLTAGPEPALESVKADKTPEGVGAAGSAEAEKISEGSRPTPNIPAASVESADTFQKRLAEQEDKSAKDPANLAEQYRLRLMYLIDGQDEKALAPADGLDAESQRILQAQLRALVSARTASRDPASWATDLLAPVEELRDQLRARADLQVPKVVLCTKIDAFGMYEPIEPAQFPAGQRNPVLVYIEVDNFRSEKTSSGLFRTLLSVRPSLLNKTGEELWSATYDNIEDLSRQQRHDFFLTVNEVLPPSLAPGEYTLKIEVEDVLAGKINSSTAKFKISASVEPASPRR